MLGISGRFGMNSDPPFLNLLLGEKLQFSADPALLKVIWFSGA